MTQERIARINELAKLAKSRELTPEEQEERQILRKEYVASVRNSLTSQLDSTYFVNSDGTQDKLEKKTTNSKQNPKPIPDTNPDK